MGGVMRGHLHNNGSRGRSYGLILLVAFCIAIFGVMAIHKLRDKRIFNLLVKEKDRELFTLQLMLQKETEYGKEAKIKLEEMKSKIHTLRIQKTELDSRILEMQSIISSLRDEQRTIELALEEKQSEIKQLRANSVDANDENNQAKALSEVLTQKEAEIEYLKQSLELPVTLQSVTLDDPANSTVNSTANAKINDSRAESQKLYESTRGELGNNSTQDADMSRKGSANNMNEDSVKEGRDNGENGHVIAERIEMTGEEQSKKVEDSQEGGLGHGGNNSNSEVGENRELGEDHKGEMKLEKPENLHGGGYTFRGRGKRGHIRKLRGKKWRIIAKSMEINENSRSEGLAGMRNTGTVRSSVDAERDRRARDENLESFNQDQDLGMDTSRKNESASVDDNSATFNKTLQGEGLKSKLDEHAGLEDDKSKDNLDENISDNKMNDGEDSSSGNVLNANEKLEGAEDMGHEVANMSGKSYISVEQLPADVILNSENNNGTAEEARQQIANDFGQTEKQATSQPDVHRTGVVEVDNSGQVELDGKDKDQEDPEMEDAQESGTKSATAGESKSNIEENGDEYQEQTNEPEF